MRQGFLCVVFVEFSCSPCGAGSCSAQQELHEVVVTHVFIVLWTILALPGHSKTTVVVLESH